MVKIRLKRLGSKRNPIYRIIVIDGREKREGKAINELGYYNPKKKDLKFDRAKALEWVKNGAQPSETVKYLIANSDDSGVFVKKEKAEEKKLSKKAKAKLEAEKAAAEKAAKEAKEKAAAEKAAKEAEAAKPAEPAEPAAQESEAASA